MALRRRQANGLLLAAILVMLCFPCGSNTQEGRPEPAGAINTPVEKWEAKACLIGARTALARGDLDWAETLVLQAENTPRGLVALIRSRWTDTPAKVWREIQSARAKERVALMELVQARDMQLAGDSERANRSVEEKSSPQEVLALPLITTARAPGEPPLAEPQRADSSPLTPVAIHQQLFFASEATAGVSEAYKDAGELLKEGARAFLAGNMEAARTCALQAKRLRRDQAWNKEDLDRLLAYLRLQRLQATP